MGCFGQGAQAAHYFPECRSEKENDDSEAEARRGSDEPFLDRMTRVGDELNRLATTISSLPSPVLCYQRLNPNQQGFPCTFQVISYGSGKACVLDHYVCIFGLVRTLRVFRPLLLTRSHTSYCQSTPSRFGYTSFSCLSSDKIRDSGLPHYLQPNPTIQPHCEHSSTRKPAHDVGTERVARLDSSQRELAKHPETRNSSRMGKARMHRGMHREPSRSPFHPPREAPQ